jgi:hypothetical protein
MEDLEVQEGMMEIKIDWKELTETISWFEKAYREYNGPNGWLITKDVFVDVFSNAEVWNPQVLDLIIDKYPNYSISEYVIDEKHAFIEFSFSGGER